MSAIVRKVFQRLGARCLATAQMALVSVPLLAGSQATTPPGVGHTSVDVPIEARLVHNDCATFPSLISAYQKRFLSPMRSWAATHLEPLGTRTLLYPFSGSDAATALGLFGRADHVVLVADNWPELTVEPAIEPKQIESECAIQAYFSQLGYLRTNDLNGKSGEQPRFIKLLAYSIAMSGGKIDVVRFLRIDADGAAAEGVAPGTKRPDGVRFLVSLPDGRKVVVDYVRIDLSNSGLSKARFRSFLSTAAADTVLLKSASHLLQDSYFSTMAGLITSQATHIVQDETGLDIASLSQAFTLTAYGRFTQPHVLWRDSESGKRLRAYLDGHPPLEPLPFTLGYEKPTGSLLMVGTRRVRVP